jgi:YjbE family integral membrane protein
LFDFLTVQEFSVFLQVIMVDLVLAGDNAIVVGMVAASVPKHQRVKVLVFGIVAATIMRIAFALITTELLQIIGLMLAGGVLLLWVCWKLWRDIEEQRRERKAARERREAEIAAGGPVTEHATDHEPTEPKPLGKAIVQIVIADVTMSLDNVLAVAGTARGHDWVLIFGLALSVALMAVAAGFIARLLKSYHWIAYIGLAVILYVAVDMMWDGANDIAAKTTIDEMLIE